MQPRVPQRGHTALVVVLVAAIIAALAAVGALVYVATRPAPDLTAAARGACQDAFRAHIRTPATAQFANWVPTSVPGGYRFNVDADYQNLAGATIRQHFHCEALHQGSVWHAQINNY